LVAGFQHRDASAELVRTEVLSLYRGAKRFDGAAGLADLIAQMLLRRFDSFESRAIEVSQLSELQSTASGEALLTRANLGADAVA
jgi:hypothetical protein